MGDLYEPPAARRALTKAAERRVTYADAVAVVQRNRQLSTEEKRQRLRMLHTAHTQAMAELRHQRHAAHRDALRQAVSDLAADHGAPSSLRLDLYQRQLAEAVDLPVADLIRRYDAASLIGYDLAMRAQAVAALGKRTGLPGDPAEALAARFAGEQLPDGHGGWGYRFPKASMAWERLCDLEAWERADHVAADAAFSVAATPAKPEDPNPPSAADRAREDVAALYARGNGTPAATTGGGSGQT